MIYIVSSTNIGRPPGYHGILSVVSSALASEDGFTYWDNFSYFGIYILITVVIILHITEYTYMDGSIS